MRSPPAHDRRRDGARLGGGCVRRPGTACVIEQGNRPVRSSAIMEDQPNHQASSQPTASEDNAQPSKRNGTTQPASSGQAQRKSLGAHWFRLAATSSAFSYACIAFSVCGPTTDEESTEPIIAYARGAWQQPTITTLFQITAADTNAPTTRTTTLSDHSRHTKDLRTPALRRAQLHLQTDQVVATKS